MKNLTEKIMEGKYSEWYKVECTNELQTKYQPFKKGETYEASKINENWWLIDTIGVSKDDFGKYFKKLEKIER